MVPFHRGGVFFFLASFPPFRLFAANGTFRRATTNKKKPQPKQSLPTAPFFFLLWLGVAGGVWIQGERSAVRTSESRVGSRIEIGWEGRGRAADGAA